MKKTGPKILGFNDYVIANAINIQNEKNKSYGNQNKDYLEFNLEQYWQYLLICGFTDKNEAYRDYRNLIDATKSHYYSSMEYHESKHYNQEVVDNIDKVVKDFVEHYQNGTPRTYASLYMSWTNQYN